MGDKLLHGHTYRYIYGIGIYTSCAGQHARRTIKAFENVARVTENCAGKVFSVP